MAVTYGFFNSVNGDRKYNAEQMSEYFRGIINEGVYQHLDGGLAVTAGTGLAVSVASGRAIIQNRWVQNSAAMSLTIAAASETYARKDAVVIRLNWSSRAISIAVKTGTPAASPVAPSMTRNSTTYEMALAYVNVAANATSVTVTDKRSDSTVCGWVTVAQSTSGEVDAQLNAMKTGFDGVTYSSPAAMVQGEDQKISDNVLSLSQETVDEISDNLFWIFPKTIENNGITCVYNDDGEIVLNGTATGAVKIPIRGVQRGLKSGTYYGTLIPVANYSSLGSAFSIRYGDYNIGIGTRWLNNGNTSVSVTLTDSDYVFLNITSGTTCNNAKYKVQINTISGSNYAVGGDTAKDVIARNDIEYLSNKNALEGNYIKLDTLKGFLIEGKAYNTTGNLTTNAAVITSDILRLSSRTVKTSITAMIGYASFDADFQFIERVVTSGKDKYVLDDNVAYVALMFTGVTLSDLENVKISGVMYEKITTVNVGATKPYTTFTDAIKRGSSLVKKEKYIINVFPGIYDVYSEIGGDTYVASLSSTVGWVGANSVLLVPTEIHGIGDVVLKMMIPNATYQAYTHQATRLSIINCRNSICVDNITFECGNNRYAIHDECDNSTDYEGSVHSYSNCRFYLSRSMAGIGIGASTGEYHVDNCYISEDTGSNAFFLHNWGTNKGGILEIKNSMLKSTQYGIRVSNNSSDNYPFNVNVNNCYIDGSFREERTGEVTKNLFRIKIQNCNINEISKDSAIVTDDYPAEVFNW